MIPDIPGALAGVLGTSGALMVGVLWRRVVFLEDRNQANTERNIESNAAVIRALDAMGQMIIRSQK